MRQKRLEIKDKKEIQRLLEQGRIGRFATVDADGYPYVVPVNYVYHQDTIYFHCSLKGEKLDNLEKSSKVCFEIDFPLAYLDTGYDPSMPVCHVGQFYQSVIIRGRGHIVEDLAEKVAALNCLMASHEGDPHFSKITTETKEVALCHVVAITPVQISAKANLAQKKTEEQRQKIRKYLEKRGWKGDEEVSRMI